MIVEEIKVILLCDQPQQDLIEGFSFENDLAYDPLATERAIFAYSTGQAAIFSASLASTSLRMPPTNLMEPTTR
jgi:hypothetical protein